MAPTPGRDQRIPMERLVRLATALHHAGPQGLPAGRLIEVAGFAGGKDAISQLAREFRHLRELGWQIDNIGGSGEDGRYRMTSVDNRLRLKLTPGQQAALRRAALLADRADLAERLGLPDSAAPAAVMPAVPQDAAQEGLTVVTRALRHNSLLRFRYNGSDRVVHPESMRAQSSIWYLRGREDGSDQVKSFVVSRMTDVSAGEPGSATRPAPSAHCGLHPMTWEQDPPTEVTLRATGPYAADVRSLLLDPDRESETDGVVEFVYRVTNREALRSRVYELGPRVELVGPDDVRDELLAELAEMAGE